MRVLPLRRSDLAEIVRIGRARAPMEACGVLLPADLPLRGATVVEIGNRAESPERSYMYRGEDLAAAMGPWTADAPRERWRDVVLWHTHPGGGVGPSEEDLMSRVDDVGNLVVSLGDPARATWY